MDKARQLAALLRDTAQSASNAIAGNVAGPVDLIGMGLNKIGVPVGDSPVGGSNWMKQQGFMRDVEQGPARVIGETAGMLGPAMVTQFAPQIARGALGAIDNAMTPRTLNSQAGVIDVNALTSKFPDLKVDLMAKDGGATLSRVVVPKEARNSGRGTEFMNELTKAADLDGSVVQLTPSSDFGGSKARLIDFYKRFGFVENKGRNKDYELFEAMYRRPQQ